MTPEMTMLSCSHIHHELSVWMSIDKSHIQQLEVISRSAKAVHVSCVIVPGSEKNPAEAVAILSSKVCCKTCAHIAVNLPAETLLSLSL